MFLVSVNGESAANVDIWQLAVRQFNNKYIFYDSSQNTEVHVTSNGVPLGCELNKTTPAVVSEYLNGAGKWNELKILWVRSDWDALKTVCLHLYKPLVYSWTAALCCQKRRHRRQHDVIELLWGAHLFESGEFERAAEQFDFFASRCQNHTTDYYSILMYYQSREYLAHGDQAQALEAIYDAFESSPEEKYKPYIAAIGGEIPSTASPHVGLTMPLYNFPLHSDRAQTSSLRSALDSLPLGRFLVVCALGSYRVNGPYNEFMRKMIVCFRCFPEYFSAIHVVTCNDDETVRLRRAYFFVQEEALVASGVDVKVLFDVDDQLGSFLQSNNSPTVLMLNKRGSIVCGQHSDVDTEIDLWKTLNSFFRDNEHGVPTA